MQVGTQYNNNSFKNFLNNIILYLVPTHLNILELLFPLSLLKLQI